MTARLLVVHHTPSPAVQEILEEVLQQVGLELVGLDAFEGLDDVVESGVTFADNALLKARYAASATGLPPAASRAVQASDIARNAASRATNPPASAAVASSLRPALRKCASHPSNSTRLE